MHTHITDRRLKRDGEVESIDFSFKSSYIKLLPEVNKFDILILDFIANVRIRDHFGYDDLNKWLFICLLMEQSYRQKCWVSDKDKYP